MSRVGQHTIREDLYNTTVDSLPDGIEVEPYEGGEVLRKKMLSQSEERGKTTEPRTIAQFYDLFKRVLEEATAEDGTNYEIRFTEEDTPADTELPAFTVKLLSRRPYADSRGRRELKPRFREEISDPDMPGNRMQVFTQRQDNEVKITVWARTNKIANRLADWVEEKFFEYTWAFRWAGFSPPVIFLGRDGDITENERNQLIHGRPMRFHVVTERITTTSEAIIRRVAVKLGINNS